MTHYTPTQTAYGELQTAFDHFNAELFEGKLPPCLITLQRKNRTRGYFCAGRFAADADTTDEIAMNPTHFATRTVTETLSTLVHEMVHLWQQHFGKAPRTCYHDKQWAAKMHTVGLMPSDTAAPGGKETGQKVSHYITIDGPFSVSCARLLATGLAITWADAPAGEEKEKKAGSRAKYTCPGCGFNAWAKHDAHITCGDCEEPMAVAA